MANRAAAIRARSPGLRHKQGGLRVPGYRNRRQVTLWGKADIRVRDGLNRAVCCLGGLIDQDRNIGMGD